MFVYVYRFDIKTGMENLFREKWKAFTKQIHLERGSLGSRLLFDSAGVSIAYAQWPSKEVAIRTAIYSDDYRRAQEEMTACLLSSQVVYELEVSDDLLEPVP